MEDYEIIYVCPMCGSTSWVENITGISIYYGVYKGEVVRDGEDVWGETEVRCPVCDITIWEGELGVPKRLLPEIERLKGKKLLLYIAEKIASGEIESYYDEDFFEKVMSYNGDDKKFARKIKPYIISYNMDR